MTAQPVLYWNEALLEANARDHTPGQRPKGFTKAVETKGPTGTSRAFAIVQLAMRDAAVAAIQSGASTYTGVSYTGPTTVTAQHAAIGSAAQCTLAALYPEYGGLLRPPRHGRPDAGRAEAGRGPPPGRGDRGGAARQAGPRRGR